MRHPRVTILLRCALCLLLLCAVRAAGAQDKMATLNLKDADINTLIATVGEITGKNFVVDPRVKGKVTVISSSPMTPDGVYQTFLAILAVHGYAAVPSGRVTEIVPEVTAKQHGGVPFGAGSGVPAEEIITRVVKVDNVPAAQLVPILRPLVPQYGHLAAYPPSNMLIISDRAGNVNRIVSIVKRLDRQGNHQVVVVPLQHASAADVVTTLNQLIQQATSKKSSAAPPATAVPDERTNSIVLSGDNDQIARMERVIRSLDAPISQTEGSTQVVYLHYAEAESLAKILSSYIKGVKAQQEGRKPGVPSAVAATGRSSANVVPAKDINALVITAPPKAMRSLKSIIAQIDIQRAQVLVQAIIAEVSADTSRRLGVNWAAFNSDRIAAASLPGLGQGTISSIAGSDGSSKALLGLLEPGGINLAAGVLNAGGTSFAILLRALYSDADTNILSTPTLVTMDNQEAEISVGKEVPFLTGSYASTGTSNSNGNVNPFQTIERKQVGLTLKLTPQINEGNTVQLEIDQEVSSLSADSAVVNAVDLITNNRTLKTTVSVHDGDILVLGGLIDNNVQTTVHAVPLLSDIPLLGALFRFRSYDRDKRNLMVFIRPVIMRDRSTASYYTRRKYEAMRDVQLNTRRNAGSSLGNKELPVMPEFEQFQSRLPKPAAETGVAAERGPGGPFAR